MAGIDVGGGGHGKKALDASIPLVPFIDLLLCCVMFLLVTAVWNELSSIQAVQSKPGESTADRVDDDTLKLVVQLRDGGYLISSTAGDQVAIPRVGDALDFGALQAKLALYRNASPNQRAITIAPDDGIAYEAVIQTMDIARATGFVAIAL